MQTYDLFEHNVVVVVVRQAGMLLSETIQKSFSRYKIWLFTSTCHACSDWVLLIYTCNPFTPKRAKFKAKEKILEFHFAKVSKTNSTTWKYCSIAFIWMVTHQRFNRQTQKLEPHFIDSRFDSGSKRDTNNIVFTIKTIISLIFKPFWKRHREGGLKWKFKLTW